MTVQEVRKAQLASAYKNNGGACVAFVDESYAAPGFAETGGGGTFYLMTAYVVPVADLNTIREDLPEVVGATYWHSTEANRTEEGRARLSAFADYIGQGSETIIVCIRKPVTAGDSNGEQARAATFAELLRVLGNGLYCEPVKLVMFEERKGATQRNIDARTIRHARTDSNVRGMHILPMSPTYERLLWLPDVASFALYQRYAKGRGEYAAPFVQNVIEFTA